MAPWPPLDFGDGYGYYLEVFAFWVSQDTAGVILVGDCTCVLEESMLRGMRGRGGERPEEIRKDPRSGCFL